MTTRNALPLLKKSFKEKIVKVGLPGEPKTQERILIKVSGGMDFIRDFHIIYGPDADWRKVQNATAWLTEPRTSPLNSHGVLINPKNMKLHYSFNMAFGDIHKKEERLVRIPMEDLFLFPKSKGPCFGETAEMLTDKYGCVPPGDVCNCIENLAQDLQKHTVHVRLPGESQKSEMHLIKMYAKTDFEEDYEAAYPGSNTPMSLSEKEKFREYGVFIEPSDLEIVFSFNTAYAQYIWDSQTVEYLTLAENLEINFGLIEEELLRRPPRGGMHGVIMYALPDPTK